EKNFVSKAGWSGGARPRRGWTCLLGVLISLAAAEHLHAGQEQPSSPSLTEQNADANEVKQLRKEVQELREDLKRLHALVASRTRPAEAAKAPAEPAVQPASVAPQAPPPASRTPGVPQYTGRSDDRGVAMATKAQGGDLSGRGNLLRTDRVTVGGYGDFQ